MHPSLSVLSALTALLWLAPRALGALLPSLVPASSNHVVISEFLYYPPPPTAMEVGAGFGDQNEFEFLELLNISEETLSLEGVAFTDGVTFEFSGTLGPGEYTLVVRNRAAFEFRYGLGLPIAGQYSGRLANEGEDIMLRDASASVIQSFQYGVSGSWPPLPFISPGGYSLELLDPESNPDPDVPEHWAQSVEREGTPGRSPDADADGLRDSWELAHFENLAAEPGEDPDNDQSNNLEEQATETDPTNPDTDQDGWLDGVETRTGVFVNATDTGTDPLLPDSDLDGLLDGVESNTGFFIGPADTGTHPLLWDTDSDGYGDGSEVLVGKDPLDPESYPIVPRILSFTATPTNLTVGESLELAWAVADADAVYLEPGIGEVANPSGSLTLHPESAAQIGFILTASNAYRSVVSYVLVQIFPDGPPDIFEFYASPDRVGHGGKTRLRWSVGGIVESVEIDQSVGSVTGNSVIVQPSIAEDGIAEESFWRYLDDGSDQGIGWAQPDFDDSHWPTGPGPLGYGNPYHQTILRFGADQSDKFITTYFRRSFAMTNTATLARALLRIRRDDGVQVFLNGVEVMRDNLPAGEIDYQTLATVHALDDGEVYHEFPIDPGLLREGDNVIAAALHQASPVSADVQFDLALAVERWGQETVTYTLTARNGAGASTAQATVGVDLAVEELVSLRSAWRYVDTGAEVGANWMEADYNDFAWPEGPGVLGNEYSGPAASLILTPLLRPTDSLTLVAYLRARFTLPVDPARVTSLSLTHLVDDGVIVYLNGQEAHRLGVEWNPDYLNASRTVVDAEFEGPFDLPAAWLVKGQNLVAVDLRQVNFDTSDIVWGATVRATWEGDLLRPRLSIWREADQTWIRWAAPGFLLESAPDPDGPWAVVPTISNEYEVVGMGPSAFYRLRRTLPLSGEIRSADASSVGFHWAE